MAISQWEYFGANSSPPLTVATFMAAVPGYSDNNIIWGDEAKARKSILKQLSLKIPLGGKFYSVSISPLATVDAFREENKYDSSRVRSDLLDTLMSFQILYLHFRVA